MPTSVFPYPGGKSYLAQWIIKHFPDHECYVEPFGGGASVLVNKPESRVEIYNDRDGDVAHFFRTLRESPTELREWLRHRPYAKDVHEQYGNQFHAGYRPDDDIERAGRFFYVRNTAFSGKYRTHSGFTSNNSNNDARTFYRNADALEDFAERLRHVQIENRDYRTVLEDFAERLRHVQIENRDYRTVLERFDSPRTLFYLDPPYIAEGDALYTGDPFDHEALVDALNELEGTWCASYTDLPPGLEFESMVVRDEPQNMSNTRPREKEYRTERLVMNYDPDETPRFVHGAQASVDDF